MIGIAMTFLLGIVCKACKVAGRGILAIPSCHVVKLVELVEIVDGQSAGALPISGAVRRNAGRFLIVCQSCSNEMPNVKVGDKVIIISSVSGYTFTVTEIDALPADDNSWMDVAERTLKLISTQRRGERRVVTASLEGGAAT